MRRNFAQILKEAKIDIKSESQFREMLAKKAEEANDATDAELNQEN